MTQDLAPRRSRLLTRVAVAISMVGGTLLLVGRPALRQPATDPRSPESGRGRHTHSPSGKALSEGFEVHDISASGLAYVLIGLAVGAMFCVGVAFTLEWILGRADTARYANLTPEQIAPVTPPGPHLLIHPEEQLITTQTREQQELHSYAWIDPQHKVARIPIDRAMTLVVGQSLDAQP